VKQRRKTVSNMTDLREHLMQTLTALRDREKPMDVDRARAVAQVASVAVETAKVEVAYIHAIGGNGRSPFLTPPGMPELSPPETEKTDGKHAGSSNRNVVQPTATGIIHRSR
jgi:hypothetical protein